MKLLIIEDDLTEANLLKGMLAETLKPQVLEHVEHLAMALDLLKSRDFDCILVDLELPDSQGLGTALAVRDRAKRTAIVVLTILEDEDTARKLLEMDIQDYLVKGEISNALLNCSIQHAIQRKRVSNRLWESEQRFAAFMLHMPVAAWMKDMQGRYVYANAEAERILSTPLTALQGKTDEELFPPDTARQFRENDERVFAQGGSLQTTEVLRQADGIDHHSIVNKFAIYDAEEKPAYVAGVALDITERRRMEIELEHFASFPLLNPTPIIEMDAEGRVTFCNKAAEQMLGRVACLDKKNPLIPSDMPNILRDLQQKKVCMFQRTVEMGEQVFDEHIYLAPEFDSVRIYVMDATESRSLEEAQNRLAAIVEGSDDAILAKTLDGIIVDWNTGAEKLYGYTAAEMKGRNMSILVPADRLDEVAQLIEKIQHGETAERIETVRVTKDGRHIPVSLTISPIRDKSGHITGTSSIAHDISERKRSEQALREAEQKLRNIVENSTNLFYMHGTDHVLTYMSPQSMQFFDCAPDDVKGSWTELITDNPVNRLAIEATQRAIDTGERQPPYQVECIGRKGRKLWAEVHEVPVLENGKVVAIVGSLTDITERKEAEEKIGQLYTDLAARAAELALANQDLEAFNYTVAHDLRKPLSVVNCYCQALKELCGSQLDTHCQEYLQEAYDGTWRMNRLIDALLNFSRLSHVEPRREKVNLSQLAHELTEELKVAEPGRRVDVRISGEIEVYGDTDLLRIALENLLGNAWKYTAGREHAVIEFGTKEIDGNSTFFVRDNGPGFDMADAAKIFIPFQRLPGAEEFRGHGIGLATVERIIRCHGGKVWAEGEPGKGATFYFTLPN